jgi:glycosyltransferase involved in cell wall biosynthesis
MRLLYLSPSGSMGGAERVLLDLMGLVRRARPAWPIGLIAAQDGPLVDESRRLGVRTTLLPFPRAFARMGDAGLTGPGAWSGLAGRAALGSISLLGYRRRLKQAIDVFAPDIIHSNGFKMHLLSAVTRPDRAALIWHMHDYLGARPLASRLIRRFAGRCDAIVAVSASVAADIREQLGEDVHVRTIWNAVDTTRFRPDGPKLDLDALAGLPPATPGIIRIGLVATFARWKGHALFLQALQSLGGRYNIRGYVVGGPVYETDGSQCSLAELRAVASGMGLSTSVGLTGFVKDSAPALRALDVVVHASTAPEPFGLVVAEAMAAGRPLVVSQGGGVAELVKSGQTALTYPQSDGEALTRQIERLIQDPHARRQLGEAARAAAVEQFDQARMSADMLSLYTRCERLAA